MKRRFASLRTSAGPRRARRDSKDSGLPSPRTMYEPRAHRARDDAQLAGAGADRALAGHQHLLAEVDLLGDVVVVAADRLVERRPRGKCRATTVARRARSITARLSSAYRCAQYRSWRYAVHLGRAGEEHRQVAVGQLGVVRERLARAAMWISASSLPMLRDPECSISHTRSSRRRGTAR